jgi:hypothetical protein
LKSFIWWDDYGNAINGALSSTVENCDNALPRVANSRERGFAAHGEYLEYLHQLDIKKEPLLYDIDQVSKYFGDNDNVDWQHIND